jgi:Protein of unknown function (DUF3102)
MTNPLAQIDREIKAQPTTPQETIEAFQVRIKAAWQKAVSSIVETGKVLHEIRKEVPHGDWGRLFQGPGKPFSSRTAGMLMAIAEHPVLSNRKHASDLPASWYCLLLLSSLPAERLELLIANKTVHADLVRSEIEAILRRENSRIRRATHVLDDHQESFPQTANDHRSPAQKLFIPDLWETYRQLKRLLIDLEDAKDEIRRDSDFRKKIRLIADRLLTIAEGDPMLVLTEKSIGVEAAVGVHFTVDTNQEAR